LQLSFPYRSKSITLDVFAPSRAGRFPIVCALHGSGGLNRAEHLNFAQLLAEQGFFVCVPHYFESTGTTWANDATIWREFETWMRVISAGLDFASTQAKADPTSIGLVGFSLGAYLALALASEQRRITAVVDFFGGMPEHFAKKLEAMPPVLILHGEADNVVPVREARMLSKLLEARKVPYEMKLYKNAGHGFYGFDMMDAGKRTYDFLKQNLQQEKSGTRSPGVA
jgi:carboxymethylenebutenolidase